MRTTKTLLAGLLTALLATACSHRADGGDARLRTAADSAAYVIGLNIGLNLQRMDSTLNVAAVCEGIRDVIRDRGRLTTDEAEAFFLRYMNHTLPEQARAYEEQFLEDLAKANRAYARTRSGITYAVDRIGDQERIPSSDRDSLYLRRRILRIDGTQLHADEATVGMTLGDLKRGLRESVRLIGEGGRITAWIPSREAYGAEGDASLGIAPNSTLGIEIELEQVVPYAEWNRRRN